MKYVLVFAALVFASGAFAQGTESEGISQFGAYVGNTLPNGIDGAEEIFPLWGIRYAHAIGPASFIDFSTFAGHSEGVEWTGAAVGISMQAPVETLIGHAGIGLDYTRYSTSTSETKNTGGGHFIGGILSPIGGNVLARFDMKLNTKPGTSLYFAIGLVFALDGGDGQ